jgi:DNA-binding LacI/PurR family transcriptional regulator
MDLREIARRARVSTATASRANSPNKPTAILCSNDLTAIGVMKKGYEQGTIIPHNLSLVGFDNVRLAQYILPPLTTVQMPQTDLAMLAFKALLAEVGREEPLPNGIEYLLQTNFLLSKSTGVSSN